MVSRNPLPFLQRIPNFIVNGDVDEECEKLLKKVGTKLAAYKVGLLTRHQVKKLNMINTTSDGGADKVLCILDKMFSNIVSTMGGVAYCLSGGVRGGRRPPRRKICLFVLPGKQIWTLI